MRILNDVFIELGFRAEIVRDQLRNNKSRWDTGIACRAARSHTDVAIQPVRDNRVAVSAALCNHSDQAFNNVKLKLIFQGTAGDKTAASTIPGTVLPFTTLLQSGNSTRPLLYDLQGAWPEFSATFDCIQPGNRGQASFIMEFPGAVSTDLVDVVVAPAGDDYGNAQPAQGNSGIILP